MNFDLQKLFNALPFPIIACDKEERRIICINPEARLLTGHMLGALNKDTRLEDILHCRYESDIRLLWKSLETQDSVQNFILDASNAQGKPLNLSLSAQIASTMEGKEIVIIHPDTAGNGEKHHVLPNEDEDSNELLFKMLYMTCHSMDPDRTINEIPETLGDHLKVDRVYIFETVPSGAFSGICEWCVPDLESRNVSRSSLPPDRFSWEEVREGLYIAGSIDTLPERDRLLLKSQNVQAIIVLPLFINNEPVGFIGCDDCRHSRVWTQNELRLLRSASAIVSTLLARRRAMEEAAHYQEIMKTVLDNIESAIYVSDFDTHEILFANKYLRETLVTKGAPLPVLEGKICWQTLQKDKDKPCFFCPKPRLLDKNGRSRGTYTWEHKNTIINKWFLVTDSAIRWIDGRYVHMENAKDISDLKKKEEELREKAGELKVAASTDPLTGIYNRQMGGVLLEEAYKRVLRTQKKSTLCFLDLDGLKNVNDTWGHREGDRMLLSFVNIIKGVIRNVDVFCRWGGDEFILLLEGCDLLKAQEYTIRRIDAGIEAFNKSEGKASDTAEPINYLLAFSYGLEELGAEKACSLDQIIASADRKMYEDKMKKRLPGA